MFGGLRTSSSRTHRPLGLRTPSDAAIACRNCMICRSAENNSIVRGESMDILNGNRRVLNVKLPFDWSNRMPRAAAPLPLQIPRTRGRNMRLVIRRIARITKPVRNVARGHKSITCLENGNLFSDDDLQLSRGYIVRFIFTGMRCGKAHLRPARDLPPSRHYAPPCLLPLNIRNLRRHRSNSVFILAHI